MDINMPAFLIVSCIGFAALIFVSFYVPFYDKKQLKKTVAPRQMELVDIFVFVNLGVSTPRHYKRSALRILPIIRDIETGQLYFSYGTNLYHDLELIWVYIANYIKFSIKKEDNFSVYPGDKGVFYVKKIIPHTLKAGENAIQIDNVRYTYGGNIEGGSNGQILMGILEFYNINKEVDINTIIEDITYFKGMIDFNSGLDFIPKE